MSDVMCEIARKPLNRSRAVAISQLRPQLIALLLKQFPQVKLVGFISESAYSKLVHDYVEEMMEKDKGELTRIEKEVLQSIKDSELLAKNVDQDYSRRLGFGERLADQIADFGGSWKFVISFLVFLLVWILSNVFLLIRAPFDPYPFILLNLLLSAIAAFQAPVIMMSQNRVEARDRMRAEHDYQVNLKAELEIRSLHEKIDHLLMKQMQHLVEIQQFQLDILNKLNEDKEEK